MNVQNFLASDADLQMGNAVAAILVLDDGRYLMQLRDDLPNIWYPGFWGLFGGGVNDGEDRMQALKRELREELNLEIGEARLFTSLQFDLRPIGLAHYYRDYYEVGINAASCKRLTLREGSDVQAFSGDQALSLPRLSPYDAFALFMYHHRKRMAGSIYATKP